MDLTEKSGQPSVEEILASIRRIIAEEPADAIFLTPKASTPSAAEVDDGADFKLPSMFRPASPQISDNVSVAPTRLTDALKMASSSVVESDNKSIKGDSAAYAALSSLKPQPRLDVTPVAPAAAPDLSAPVVAPVLTAASVSAAVAAQIPTPFAPPSVAAAEVSEAPVARRMASFSDNRFKSISALPPAPPAPTPVAVFQPVAEPVAVSALVPAVAPAPKSAAPKSAEAAPAEVPASSGIEDQTAELLRPMLRQWLMENMPRMVEKALFMEVNTTNGQKKD